MIPSVAGQSPLVNVFDPRQPAVRSGSGCLRIVASLSVLALLGACGTGSSPGGSGPPSSIAPGSPWLGAFIPVGLPPPVNSLRAVACASTSACWAVGSTVGMGGAPNGAVVIATSNRGATWNSQVIPATVGYLSGVACADVRHCTAVGQASQSSNGQGAIIATSNGGATWNQQPLPGGTTDITAVTCLTDRRCTAIGTVVGGAWAIVSQSPGSPWKQAGTLPTGVSGATSISCPDDRHCWVTAHTTVDVDHVAGVVAFTANGSATWVANPTPTGIGYLNGVSCFDGAAQGGGALPYTPAAATPPASGPGSATSTTAAPAAGVAGVGCTVVGTTEGGLNGVRSGHGVILTTANGGATWTSQPVTDLSAALMDVSCTAAQSCVAVGTSVATQPEAGLAILTGPTDHAWRKAATVGSPQPLSAVSCVTLSSCVVVGESISEHLAGG